MRTTLNVAAGAACARLGRALGRYLNAPSAQRRTGVPTDLALLAQCIRIGDVLLVEGNTRVSVAIKYLTQSTWSHAALYVGPLPGQGDAVGEPPCFIEADVQDGVRAVGFAAFSGMHSRICRPVGLRHDELDALARFACDRIGHRYDLKNVFDLARYLIPTPPVPVRWRRRMIAFGSGDPTRAICSTLIAQAFQSVRYPILPIVEMAPSDDPKCRGCMSEILHIRHHSLFVPRDFDISPYFAVVKPTLAKAFDPHALGWADPPAAA